MKPTIPFRGSESVASLLIGRLPAKEYRAIMKYVRALESALRARRDADAAKMAILENSKDFSKAEFIDAQTGRRIKRETEAERNRALFGSLAHTVKKLKRSKS